MDYSKLRLKQYDTYGRMVGYASDDSGQEQLFKNLRENPHRLNLGAIGLSMVKNGRRAAIPDLSNTRQKLVLWRGLLISGFRVFGKTVRVETCSDPELDAVSACVRSELVMSGEIEIQLSFPYGSPGKNASDWEKEDAHVSEMVVVADNRVIIKRVLDSDVYYADIVLGHGSGIRKTGRHRFVITAGQDSKEISFTCRFSPGMPEEAPYDFFETKRRASVHGRNSGNQAAPCSLSIRKTSGRSSLSAGSCCRNTLPQFNAAARRLPRKPGFHATVGTANSTWKCITGMRRILPCGAGLVSSSGALNGTGKFRPRPGKSHPDRVTREPGGQRCAARGRRLAFANRGVTGLAAASSHHACRALLQGESYQGNTGKIQGSGC
ncbi:MAG: hypothetical protein ACOX4M_05585 [Acetivibrionales bacterium]